MGTIKVELEDKLLEEFKKKAMETFGYKKGSIKLATKKLIEEWVLKKESSANWSLIRGVAKTKGSSVKLQHEIWKKGVD